MTPPPKRLKGKEILPETPVGYELPKFKVDPGENFDGTPYVYHYDKDNEDRTGWDEINWNERISRFMREVQESRGYAVITYQATVFKHPVVSRRLKLKELTVKPPAAPQATS